MAKKKRGAQRGNQNASKGDKAMSATSVRTTPEQFDRWMDAADRDGKSISAWIRWACDQMS